MAGLVLLVLLLLVFFSITGAIARAARRRRMLEEEAERQRELARQRGDQPVSPFAGLPFGGLLEAMLGGAGGWTRTMEYDERTGHWRDIGSPPAPNHGQTAKRAAEAPADQQQFTRRAPRRAAPANPLSTLLGGATGGASGEFGVQSPDELITFDKVGGMKP